MDRKPTKPVEKGYQVPFGTNLPTFNLTLGTYVYSKPTEPSQEPSGRPVRAEDMTPFHKGFDELIRARKDEKRAAKRLEREASRKRQRQEVQARRKASRAVKAKPGNTKPVSGKPANAKSISAKPASTRPTDMRDVLLPFGAGRHHRSAKSAQERQPGPHIR